MITAEQFAKAYRQGFNRTRSFLISRGVGAEAAEEASQAAWALGWERLSQLRDALFLQTWINTISLNCFRQALRRSHRMVALQDVPAAASINCIQVDLAKVLKLCDEPQRSLLRERLEGRSIDELAVDRQTTNLAIRLRLRRARFHARMRSAKAA